MYRIPASDSWLKVFGSLCDRRRHPVDEKVNEGRIEAGHPTGLLIVLLGAKEITGAGMRVRR
jgi:hypothetical protein